LPGGSQPPGCPLVPAGSGNNGNVIGYTYTDTVSFGMNHSALYVYDTLNRLACAQATGSATYNLAFTYDRYGNMACQTNGQTNGPCPNWTFNSSANQITTAGYTYDAAGNVTSDNLTNYQWDAEGRLISVNNGAYRSYVYNALGREVEWHGDGRVSEDLTDLAGHYLGSVDPSSGAWTGERIPGSSIYLAWYVNGGTTFFHYNALGSSMMNTHQDGNTVSNDVLFYPWGQMWASPVNDYFQFFGNIEGWDWEIGEGVTPNRYYPNYQGRWLSPDPLAGDISNPQSLNRYAYVRNNPTTLTDPSGLCSKDPPNGYEWNPGCTQVHRIPCNGMVCADQYYGGSLFEGYTSTYMPVCVKNGIAGYCGQGLLAFNYEGNDAFDINNPASGVYWTAPPGSAVTNSSGRTSTSTGSLGYSDLVWSELNNTSNVLESLPSATPQDRLNNLLGLQALSTGNYLFGPSTASASSTSPGVTAFGPVATLTGWIYIPNLFNPGAPDLAIPKFKWPWSAVPGS
jgi:RHS repeat-associated protein